MLAQSRRASTYLRTHNVHRLDRSPCKFAIRVREAHLKPCFVWFVEHTLIRDVDLEANESVEPWRSVGVGKSPPEFCLPTREDAQLRRDLVTRKLKPLGQHGVALDRMSDRPCHCCGDRAVVPEDRRDVDHLRSSAYIGVNVDGQPRT